MFISIEVTKHLSLFGGRAELSPGDRAEVGLGLAVRMVRRGEAWPVTDEATFWVLLGLWLQDSIPRVFPTQSERRQRRRQLRADHLPVSKLGRGDA